ncbi:MAG: matrixin family metalloprotease, partial [Myxococcales bacterium]|nr:matrixin family metalloprotease [Myxococcales bacterium]
MKRLFCAVALSMLLAGPAGAYVWNNAKWGIGQGDSVPYVVSEVLSQDMPDGDCLEAVQLGYDAWTAVSCSYMAWQYAGRTANTAWGAGDGENVASWREDFWDDSPVALAIASTIWGGVNNFLSDTDIKFNGFHHTWAYFRMAPGGDGRTDVSSVAAHEVGHCNGFGHSDVPGATMWPSTGPGDISGRTLSADDIQAVCDVYPSGGEVPPPDMEPPPPIGNVEFGGDCSMERCVEGLFCLNDGRDLYCSRPCEPGDDTCGDGYYCAFLADGGGACARGQDPGRNQAGFGEECGNGLQCQSGLVCVNDDGRIYCTGPCLNDMCPNGYLCAELQNGESICARGDGAPGDLPGAGQPCNDRGLCARGLFCIRDPLNVDEQTGELVPYCTAACDNGMCDEGFRCIDLQPDGTACQLIPSAGSRALGDPCWVNPEAPFSRPSCGDDLVCTDYVIEDQVVVEKGFCTANCSPDDCCPEGWGCAELTPVFGQCRPDVEDSPRFRCQGGMPP